MKYLWPVFVVGGALTVLFAAEPAAKKSHLSTTVSLRKLADSLHAVMVADRDAYLAEVVEPAGTNRAAYPPHARMQRLAARNIQGRGAEFSYTLRSLWPMQEKNGPQTQAEQEGLERVSQNPAQPIYLEEELGGRSYYTAVYPDRATRASCTECHNASPHSPRHDFKTNDVMGALIIRVPLEF